MSEQKDGRSLPAHSVMWCVFNDLVCRKQHAASEPHEFECTTFVPASVMFGEPQVGTPEPQTAPETEQPSFRAMVLDVCMLRGWSLHWTHRSAYLHLEAAELAEAVRGKRGSTLDESADVLITLLALSPHDLPEIEQAAWCKLVDLTTKPPYVGEERAALSGERPAEPTFERCPKCNAILLLLKCDLCAEGYPRNPSSLDNGAFVHNGTPEGRVVCSMLHVCEGERPAPPKEEA